MSVDIFDCHDWDEEAISIYWVEVRDAAKYLTMNRAAPYNKELSNPKCQYWGG